MVWSLVQGAIRSTRLEPITSALDPEFYIGPPRVDCAARPRLPPEVVRALDWPSDATLADVVAAIAKDALAFSLREGISLLPGLLGVDPPQRVADSGDGVA